MKEGETARLQPEKYWQRGENKVQATGIETLSRGEEGRAVNENVGRE